MALPGADLLNDDLFIFAGEPSGDLHGEQLLSALYTLDPSLKIHGVGGPRMRTTPMKCTLEMEAFQVMGFRDVLFSLPSLWKHFNRIKKDLLKNPPKAIVTIDYPGFNLRLHQSLSKNHSPSKQIHYISPSVWAWGKRRIPKMERSLDSLLTILPFEVDLFSKEKLTAHYVGNPIVSRIQDYPYNPQWKSRYFIEEGRPILSIFPGSRLSEINILMPILLRFILISQSKNNNYLSYWKT